jgi:hypothetical protein
MDFDVFGKTISCNLADRMQSWRTTSSISSNPSGGAFVRDVLTRGMFAIQDCGPKARLVF